MFNFKNKHCQAAFREATEHNEELVICFNNKLPFEEQSRKWKKTFNSVLHKCFKKVRIVGKKKVEEGKLKMFEMLKERAKMKKDLKNIEITDEMREKIEERIKQIEAEIEKEFSEECIKDVMETLREWRAKEKIVESVKKEFPQNIKFCSCGKKGHEGKYYYESCQFKAFVPSNMFEQIEKQAYKAWDGRNQKIENGTI